VEKAFIMREESKMTYKRYVAGATLLVCVAAGIGLATAAETGTKTMPDSSIYPPRMHRPIYNYHVRHRHECYLPSSHCNDQHRIQN
jgi:hypothetical protein